MPSEDHITQPDAIPFRSVTLFLLLTFGIAWGILGAFIFFHEAMVGLFGEITGEHPLFYLAVWAPAISALIVIFRWSGLEGIRRLLGRALLWRCSWPWYAFLLLGVPLVFFAGSFFKGNLSETAFPFPSVSSFLVALFHFMLINPAWPDAQPYDTYIFALVAAVIVWLNRETLFTRKYSIIEVVPQKTAPNPS